ncbi:hypothetical protein OOU_Y34scaffold00081g1 [Pyricularia oryzae Y34]|uniref:Uncharacterized protein n=2 Tax=Pyricularia oryzae TaxID=318829 RepID=A0AA97PRS4_PYRO3|nr:hypothetical protein OOU_Y34scaffold00081g1 [Pyricularia oryzae Y34]
MSVGEWPGSRQADKCGGEVGRQFQVSTVRYLGRPSANRLELDKWRQG